MNWDFPTSKLVLLIVGSSEDPVTQQITDNPHGAGFYRMEGKIPRLKGVCEWDPCMSLDMPISSDADVLLSVVTSSWPSLGPFRPCLTHPSTASMFAISSFLLPIVNVATMKLAKEVRCRFYRMIDIDRITSDIVMIGSDTRN